VLLEVEPQLTDKVEMEVPAVDIRAVAVALVTLVVAAAAAATTAAAVVVVVDHRSRRRPCRTC
jgi:hypothetical protein